MGGRCGCPPGRVPDGVSGEAESSPLTATQQVERREMKILRTCGSLRQESWNRQPLVSILDIAGGNDVETAVWRARNRSAKGFPCGGA